MSIQALRSAIGDLHARISEWRANPAASMIFWNGAQVQAISEQIFAAIANLQLALQKDFPEEHWHTALSCDRLVNEFHAWNDRRAVDPVRNDPSATQGSNFWDYYENDDCTGFVPVVTKCTEPRLFQTELSPKTYVDIQKVPVRQVAKIMGWFDEAGNPDLNRVHDELANPGKHFNAETHVTPADQEREQYLAARWEEREIARSEQERLHPVEPPAPESLDELVQLPGMSIKQIMKMLPAVTREDVIEMADLYEVHLTDQPYAVRETPTTPTEKEAARDRELEEQAARGQQIATAHWYPEVEDMEERVCRMYADGLTAQPLHEVLVRQFGEQAPAKTEITKWIKNLRRRNSRAEAAAAE
jgi:hypothetical protein